MTGKVYVCARRSVNDETKKCHVAAFSCSVPSCFGLRCRAMSIELTIALSLAILVVGFLYASVGHAGASGYIAIMSLFSLDPSFIKPTALLLNIVVASITAWQFYRAGFFSWSLFWPFALLAIPFAFLGGSINLPAHSFKMLVGCVLLFSAYRFLLYPQSDTAISPPKRGVAMMLGAGLGLLSGLTGTGGGIFLTPLLLFKRWATTKAAAATSALFILLNSTAGLAGYWSSTQHIPSIGLYMVFAAVAGGTMGSYLGSRRFNHIVIKRLLSVVLLIAGVKLILTCWLGSTYRRSDVEPCQQNGCTVFFASTLRSLR